MKARLTMNECNCSCGCKRDIKIPYKKCYFCYMGHPEEDKKSLWGDDYTKEDIEPPQEYEY